MGELLERPSQGVGDNQRFRCDFCDIEHDLAEISCNGLGYPVCPACEYEHGS